MNPCITRPVALSPHRRHQPHQPHRRPYRRRWPWEQAENDERMGYTLDPLGYTWDPLGYTWDPLGYTWDPLRFIDLICLFWNSVGFISFSMHVRIFLFCEFELVMLNWELLTALESPKFKGWIGVVDFEGPIDLICNHIGKGDFAYKFALNLFFWCYHSNQVNISIISILLINSVTN